MPDTVTDITTLKSDSDLIKHLMQSEDSLNTIISDDIDAQTLRNCLELTSRSYRKAQDAISRLKPIFGRILLLYKQRPEMYKELNYHNWDDWMTRGVCENYNIARAEAFACVSIAEKLSDIPTGTLQELGMGKLKAVTQAMKMLDKDNSVTVEMREAKRDEWIEEAKTNTVRGLKILFESRRLVDESDLDPKEIIVIDVAPRVKDIWDAFIGDAGVQDYCGTKATGGIFEKMLEEVGIEWRAQFNDANRIVEVGQA